MKNLHRFVTKNKENWRELEVLVQRGEKGLRSLSDDELDKMGRLYRQTASDLALAQRDFPRQKVAVYLNNLVGRAHALIYQEKPMQKLTILRFFTHTFPQIYRQLAPYTLLAFLIFLLPAIIAFGAVVRQPQSIYTIMGENVEVLVQQVEEGKMWTEIPLFVRSAASTFILTNNIKVMFLTFAGGVTAGLLTFYVLLSNGLHMGALFGLLQVHGMSGKLAEFVVAHGFIELSVIFFIGGVGLYIGDGLLRPGLQSRRDALMERTMTGVRAVLGCIPLLIVAGIIEGFLSPSILPWGIKAGVGIISGVVLYSYWLLAGRD